MKQFMDLVYYYSIYYFFVSGAFVDYSSSDQSSDFVDSNPSQNQTKRSYSYDNTILR